MARIRRWTQATSSAPRNSPGEELGRGRLWFPFLDKEHRDAVDDRIEDLALRAAEMVRFLELQLGVALGARQNLEELLGDHAPMVVRFEP